MTSKRTLIEALRRIPEDQWGTTAEEAEGKGKRSVLGHLIPDKVVTLEQHNALKAINHFLPNLVEINDNESPSYPQKTPKFRVLAALAT